MLIAQVINKIGKNSFHEVARIIYKQDTNWVCPLDKEIESIFDPQKNVFFKHGEASRWILFDDQKHLIGRIAAFIDRQKQLFCQ